MNNLINDIMTSWTTTKGIYDIKDILQWIEDRNKNVKVEIKKISLQQSEYWFYDKNEGVIKNKNESFFKISGLRQYKDKELLKEQPIIIQDEIGFLGIICKKINGILHFLMQAKIEPGNINKIQLSPTIQATKSNFTVKHGGKKPLFLDYFINNDGRNVIVDQVQSEQSSRFLKKRNRNVIIYTEDDIEENSTHRWLTLGQIKLLMRYDNLVNMDTRTVISCIPFSLTNVDCNINVVKNKALLNSITANADYNSFTGIYKCINDYKMFNNTTLKLADLFSLHNWEMKDNEYCHKHYYPFKIIFCDIMIEGREVTRWTQPLFEATNIATFGLFCCTDNSMTKFLIKAKPEIGCFDGIELGPTVQQDGSAEIQNNVEELFFNKLASKGGVVTDVMLSEEGGRFYHEQNRNVIIEINKEELKQLPEGYFWCDFKTLNLINQFNNQLNIQLRNLLSLLEM
jgi:oxidase EvaA